MKEKKQIIALVVLLLIAGAVWFWNNHQGPATAQAKNIADRYVPMNTENTNIQWWKLDKVRSTDYKGSGRNPFSAVPLPPPVQKVPQPGEKGYVPTPAPPPPAPELPPNMKFFGYGTVPNGTARRAFLTDGDEIYIVAEGDTLLGRFRITKIGNATIEFQEISSGRQGHANLEDIGPPS